MSMLTLSSREDNFLQALAYHIQGCQVTEIVIAVHTRGLSLSSTAIW